MAAIFEKAERPTLVAPSLQQPIGVNLYLSERAIICMHTIAIPSLRLASREQGGVRTPVKGPFALVTTACCTNYEYLRVCTGVTALALVLYITISVPPQRTAYSSPHTHRHTYTHTHLYMNSPHVLHCKEKGIIIRTPICFSGSRFIRGTFFGSKSGGKYLFRTLRSPMVEEGPLSRPWRGEKNDLRCYIYMGVGRCRPLQRARVSLSMLCCRRVCSVSPNSRSRFSLRSLWRRGSVIEMFNSCVGTEFIAVVSPFGISSRIESHLLHCKQHNTRRFGKTPQNTPGSTQEASERSKSMAVSEADAIKDLTDEEVEDLRETFRTFDKVCACVPP